MAEYYLCRTARARHPYYIESVGINIWSIEELCYYMRENVYLLDETILNVKLCDWLGQELGLEKLRRVMMRALESQGGAEEFVMPIFQECGYLTGPELSWFHEKLMQVQIEPRDVRKKMKADYLVKYGLYVSALEEYDKILKRRSPGRLGIQFYAAVCENMAAAYARMFRFEEAADCLWASYSALKSRKVYEKYLRILPLFLPERKYQERLEEIRADRDLAAAMKEDTAAILQEAQQSDFAKEWAQEETPQRLERLKREYIACTKN
ncbi:MAG: hypothetical protein Q4C50_00490 [Eubacteriales bacterium]|nr:hypothetical protein [Eubacteriales bacterium]